MISVVTKVMFGQYIQKAGLKVWVMNLEAIPQIYPIAIRIVKVTLVPLAVLDLYERTTFIGQEMPNERIIKNSRISAAVMFSSNKTG